MASSTGHGPAPAPADGVVVPARSSAPLLLEALAAEGFEPHTDPDGTIRLGNCPFHALATTHRGLTCGMNLALLSGLLDGVGAAGWTATLEPRTGSCCVAFAPPSGGSEARPRSANRA